MSNWRKFAPVFSLAIIGLINLNNVAGKPRFQTFQTIDVVQLIATGMSLAAALDMLVTCFCGRRSD